MVPSPNVVSACPPGVMALSGIRSTRRTRSSSPPWGHCVPGGTETSCDVSLSLHGG